MKTKLINHKPKNVLLQNLKIGTTFLDKDSEISIKINDKEYLILSDNSIWSTHGTFLRPIKITHIEYKWKE